MNDSDEAVRLLRRAEVDGVRFEEVAYAPGYSMPEHTHGTHNVSLVLAGSVHETVGAATSTGRAGSVVRKPAGTLHEDGFGDRGARMFAVVFDAQRGFGDWRWSWFGPPMRTLLRLCKALREDRGGFTAAAKRELPDLFSTRCDEPGVTHDDREPPSWLEGVLADIEARVLEPGGLGPVRVRDLAERAGVHPVHLARVFRRWRGGSVREYMRSVRVREAARQLADDVTPLAEIAYDCGFSDQAHFTRCFRASSGLSPKRFRDFVRL